MIRWPLTILGIIIVVLGFMIEHKHPPLPAEPEQLSIDEAVMLAGAEDRHYIALQNAKADTNRIVYSTFTKEPLYTLRPTDSIYDLTEDAGIFESDLSSYAGCFVKIAAAPDSRYGISLQITSENEKTDEKKVLQQRWLVPLQGTKNRIWALSKVFRKDDPAVHAWNQQVSMQGGFSVFSNLNRNADDPALDFSWQEIQEFAQKEFGVAPRDDAFVILTDQEFEHRFCILPVIDGKDTLFVIGSTGDRWTNTMVERIAGILEPSPISWYEDLQVLLGDSVPDHIGIINDETATAYNKRFAESASATKTTGSVILGLGVLGQLRHAFRKKKK